MLLILSSEQKDFVDPSLVSYRCISHSYFLYLNF